MSIEPEQTAAHSLLPSLRLDGRTALITGGGAGIGRETSRVLAAAGAHVLVTDIDGNAARAAAAAIRAEGGTVSDYRLDVTKPEQVLDVCDQADREHGPVQILVNNAGIVTMAPFLEMTEAEFDAVLAVSLKGTYLMTRALLPAMRESGWGRIVSLSSMMGKNPAPYAAHYGAAKAGIIGFTQSIAQEAAPQVTVNCLCPTNIETAVIDHDIEFFRERDGISAEELIQQWIEDIPLGRLGQPLDVARAVLLLASDAGAFTTGQAINVSGGQQVH